MKYLRKFFKRFRIPALILAVPLLFLTGCGGEGPQTAKDVGAQLANDVQVARSSAFLVLQIASDTLYAVTSSVKTEEDAVRISVAEALSFKALDDAHTAMSIADDYINTGNYPKAKEYLSIALANSQSVFTVIGVEPNEKAQDAIDFVKGFVGEK